MAEAITTVSITPKMLAEAFWNMDSTEQVQVFEELNKVVQFDYATKPNSQAWSLGEMQWFYLGDALGENKDARDMLMSIAAPLYLHTLRCAHQ
jgi:hypothetical protein